MWTPLGPAKSVLIREVSLFQGLNYTHLYCVGTRGFCISGSPHLGVPLYNNSPPKKNTFINMKYPTHGQTRSHSRSAESQHVLHGTKQSDLAIHSMVGLESLKTLQNKRDVIVTDSTTVQL